MEKINTEAVVLIQKGKAQKAFEIRKIQLVEPNDNEVLIEVESFGLNYADVMARNGLYTKQLQQPETSSQHTLRIQRKCANPIGAQKPFPFATSTGTGIKRGGTNATSVGNSCNTTQNIYLAPPEWYIKSSSGIN